MKKDSLKTLPALIVGSVIAGTAHQPCFATDWPEWGREPHRNMYSPEKNLPAAFGKIEFKSGTEEIDAKTAEGLVGPPSWAHKATAM